MDGAYDRANQIIQVGRMCLLLQYKDKESLNETIRGNFKAKKKTKNKQTPTNPGHGFTEKQS